MIVEKLGQLIGALRIAVKPLLAIARVTRGFGPKILGNRLVE
jgi:hypothetical protein